MCLIRKYAGSEGRIHTRVPVPTLPRKWVPWVTNPTPPTKGCKQPGPNNVETSVNFLPHSRMVLPAVPALFFFSVQKCFRTFFAVLPEVLCLRYFAHFFFCRFFRTFPLHMFLTHLFRAVCCPKGLHTLQPQHCAIVPETGHTTTRRSNPSLLTQHSHKQVV